MPYEIKPLACDPTAINGMSERLIVSHYENNYGGAVQRLNAITKELAELDFTSAPIFVINGLKREELIAMNSMILHEIFFASLGERGEPEGALRDALIRDFGSVSAWTSPRCRTMAKAVKSSRRLSNATFRRATGADRSQHPCEGVSDGTRRL
jgi:Fe-Mn family superoxide dismutase